MDFVAIILILLIIGIALSVIDAIGVVPFLLLIIGIPALIIFIHLIRKSLMTDEQKENQKRKEVEYEINELQENKAHIDLILDALYSQYKEAFDLGYKDSFKELHIYTRICTDIWDKNDGKIGYTLLFYLNIEEWVLKFLKEDFIVSTFTKEDNYSFPSYCMEYPIFRVNKKDWYTRTERDKADQANALRYYLKDYLSEHPNAEDFVSIITID